MPPKAVRAPLIPDEPRPEYSPLLPTVVIASYKGGVGKTAISVALAERLAYAGLRVLLLTCDSQEDARARLGVKASEPRIASRSYGHGAITVVGIRGPKAIDVLYRIGPERLGLGSFDLAVLDTPPEVHGGRLPGVLLITPVDGVDAIRNLLTMFERTPANTDIVLVKIGRMDAGAWERVVDGMEGTLGRALQYLPEPLPRARAIHEAHDEGQSVWALRRTGGTLTFLKGIHSLAHLMWHRLGVAGAWPTSLPATSAMAPFVPGWDDED